jgi:hypothetical protein
MYTDHIIDLSLKWWNLGDYNLKFAGQVPKFEEGEKESIGCSEFCWGGFLGNVLLEDQERDSVKMDVGGIGFEGGRSLELCLDYAKCWL